MPGRASGGRRGRSGSAAIEPAAARGPREASDGRAAEATPGAASSEHGCGDDDKLHPADECQTASARGRKAFADSNPYNCESAVLRAFSRSLALALVVRRAGRRRLREAAACSRSSSPLEVNPVTQDYVTTSSHARTNDGYDAAVILLDTPGGLSESMRKIVKNELALEDPGDRLRLARGARAASAGVWIAQAADVLAMAPQTNIGSSTPIDSGGQNIDSDLRRKVINDAAASLRAWCAATGATRRGPRSRCRKASNLDGARGAEDERGRRGRADAAGAARASSTATRRVAQGLRPAHSPGREIDHGDIRASSRGC